MIRLIDSKHALPAPTAKSSRGEAPAAAQRALVALAPIAAVERGTGPTKRPAAFLAQLIATKDKHPQTRERRRAEPDEAIAAYRSVADLMKR